MSAAQMVSFGSVGVVDNTTRFFSVSGCILTAQATEVNAEAPIRDAGTVDKLFARVTANSATNGSTVTVRKSQADTAVTLSIGGDATGEFEDVVNSVAFVATDEIDIEVTVATEGGTNVLTLSMVGCVVTPSSGTASVQAACGQFQFASASTTAFWGLCDKDAAAVDEGRHEWIVRSSFTASHLFATVSANLRTTNTIVKSRKNRADGAMSVTYGNAETGYKEDASNSDSVASGDEFNCAITTSTGTEIITFQNHGVRLASGDGRYPLIAHGSVTQAFNVTNYLGPGDVAAVTTTEANTQMRSRFATTLREFAVMVTANSIATSPTLVRMRVNGGNGNQSVSYAAGETGQKVDASNTDVLDTDDQYNFQVATPNTSGTFTVRHVSVLGEATAVAAGQPTMRRWGGVEFMGGQRVPSHGSGRMWGRLREAA